MEQGPHTILLVDDEDMVLDAISELLIRTGYRVISVNSGQKAIDQIKENGHLIDLVVLDMIMPEMNGETTFHRIRAIQPDIPIILASGYNQTDQIKDVMNADCDGFVQKPFHVSELHLKIQRILVDKISTKRADYDRNH